MAVHTESRRWQRHFRNIQGVQSIFPTSGGGPGGPALTAPWLSDVVQLTFPLLPDLSNRVLPNPAAGANFTVGPPPGFAWLVNSLRFVLTTDATAANRVALFRVDDQGGNFAYQTQALFTQVASTSIGYLASDFGQVNLALVTGSTLVTIPSPPFWVPPGFTLRSAVQSLQAADALTDVTIFHEAWPG